MLRVRELVAVLLFGIVILTGAAAAQGPRDAARTAQDSPTDRTISVAVDVVLIPVTVTDSSNRNVSGLRKDHFQVWEDKIEQEIEYFSTENAAMSLGIVLDTSESMGPGLTNARRNAATCLEVSDRSDEYTLVTFASKVEPATEFTTDILKLQQGMSVLRARGSTSLYDAIYEGFLKVKEGSNPRKALVVVTDGYENNSRTSISKLKEAVKESEVQIFSMGNEGDGVLRELTQITGGRAFSPQNRSFQLGNICNAIVQEMKSQYVLGYKSSNTSGDGKWRGIRVKVNAPPSMDKLNVRAKTGYQGSDSKDLED